MCMYVCVYIYISTYAILFETNPKRCFHPTAPLKNGFPLPGSDGTPARPAPRSRLRALEHPEVPVRGGDGGARVGQGDGHQPRARPQLQDLKRGSEGRARGGPTLPVRSVKTKNKKGTRGLS